MQSIITRKISTDDVQKERDTIKDDMEVDTEANVYEPFEEHVQQVKLKPVKLKKI